MPTEQTNQEIIDATQDAVLNAADNVVSVIENTAHEISGHSEVFYQSAEFWVAVSFVLVVVLLARPVGKIAYRLLKKRGENIAGRIYEVECLKEDAQKLLSEYERKYRKAEQEAQEILARSEREINLLKRENLAKLEDAMANKEREAKARIVSAQEKAVQEIAAQTSSLTISAVKAVLAKTLDERQQDRLIDESIELLGKIK